ncbi:MAG: MFS transporter [Granulosicoccus sp.]
MASSHDKNAAPTLASQTQDKRWTESLKAFFHPRVVTMLFLGFSAGIPILLIFSSLSLWLREAGVEKSAVTFFSWAALGYSFKFIWAPLVDRLPLPVLTGWLGRRRGWMLLSQMAVIGSLLWMALTDPALATNSLTLMALAAVALGFSSATQDIVIDAYRIDSASMDLQALMSSTYIAGYRIGMLIAGAGALYLADFFGSTTETYNYAAWRNTYVVMSTMMLIGIVTTFVITEPERKSDEHSEHPLNDHLRFFVTFLVAVIVFILVFRFSGSWTQTISGYLSEVFNNRQLGQLVAASARLAVSVLMVWIVARLLIGLNVVNGQMVRDAYMEPVRDFFSRYGKNLAILLLLLVGFYRVSDIVLGVIANVFYQDMGYTKTQIASVSKVFGLWMTIIGGFLGGLLSVRFGVMRILLLGAVLSAGTNLLFLLLADGNGTEMVEGTGNIGLLYLVIGADNLSAGLASAAFIAFLSSLTNISFTAVQYAIFSSLMTLFPKVLGGYSGTLVESMGYASFFIMTALLTVPVIVLILIAGKRFDGKVEFAR